MYHSIWFFLKLLWKMKMANFLYKSSRILQPTFPLRQILCISINPVRKLSSKVIFLVDLQESFEHLWTPRIDISYLFVYWYFFSQHKCCGSPYYQPLDNFWVASSYHQGSNSTITPSQKWEFFSTKSLHEIKHSHQWNCLDKIITWRILNVKLSSQSLLKVQNGNKMALANIHLIWKLLDLTDTSLGNSVIWKVLSILRGKYIPKWWTHKSLSCTEMPEVI